jgi:hypothetical protein
MSSFLRHVLLPHLRPKGNEPTDHELKSLKHKPMQAFLLFKLIILGNFFCNKIKLTNTEDLLCDQVNKVTEIDLEGNFIISV